MKPKGRIMTADFCGQDVSNRTFHLLNPCVSVLKSAEAKQFLLQPQVKDLKKTTLEQCKRATHQSEPSQVKLIDARELD